jgi:hypothetical protein
MNVSDRMQLLEAKIMQLETPDCFACGAKVTERCRRRDRDDCGREFEGGTRAAEKKIEV